jgi:hypothetical protein
VASLQVELDSISTATKAASSATAACVPVLYELYSVMVHSGSAHGGHYYALSKSFERGGKWFCFNDAHVTEVNLASIYKTFGYESEAKSAFGANAYMLAYRRMDHGNLTIVEDTAIHRAIIEEFAVSGVAKDIGYVPYAVRGSEEEEEVEMEDFAEEMIVCSLEDESGGDDEMFAATEKEKTQRNPATVIIEVNLLMMPALDIARETITVSPDDPFESFYGVALASLGIDRSPSETRMRMLDPVTHTVFRDHPPMLPGAKGTLRQALGSKIAGNVSILVEVTAADGKFPSVTDILVRVTLEQPQDADTPIMPFGARYLWLSSAAKVGDLQRAISESWPKLWRLSTPAPSPAQISVAKIGSVTSESFDCSVGLASTAGSPESMVSCVISCPLAVASQPRLQAQVEPFLKIQKHDKR